MEVSCQLHAPATSALGKERKALLLFFHVNSFHNADEFFSQKYE
jgi:hypothetical protein